MTVPICTRFRTAFAVRFLLCFLAGNLCGFPAAHAQQISTGTESFEFGQEACLSAADYAVIEADVKANVAVLQQRGLLSQANPDMIVSFGWPLKLKNGLTDPSYFGISALVDHNATTGLLDYHCGNRTYDGHKGTDIFTWPFSWYKMDNNEVEIIAAAAGTIVEKYDGNYDRHCSWVNGAQGNGVIVLHTDGSKAIYWHMKRFSLTAKGVGDAVAAGEYLGVVGSSGISSGPHLHFEVHDAANLLIDPWAGTCNGLNAQSWWADQRPYPDPKVNKIMTHSTLPSISQCGPDVLNVKNQFQPGNLAYFIAYYRDLQAGQVSNFSILQPNGVVWYSTNITAPTSYISAYNYLYATLPTNALNGTWKFRVIFNGETTTHNFTVGACPLSPATTVTPVTCNGGTNGMASVAVNNGTAPYTYLWNNGQSAAMAINLAAGMYTATATDAYGCTGTATATVTQPSALALNSVVTAVSCDGGPNSGANGAVGLTVSGGNAPYTYLWSDAQTTATAIELTAGIYTATVSDANGCSFTTVTAVGIVPADDTVQVLARVFLQGPYVAGPQLMHDSLRVKNLLPLTEPYTGLSGFTHVGGGGGEQTTPAVLAITGSDAIVDWVFLELRSTADPALVLATRAALLQRDGDVVDVDGVALVLFALSPEQNCYLTIRHRNHLGIQTGEALFYPVCDALATDFSSALPEGFYDFNGLNSAQKTIGGVFALWAGNGRVDFQLKYNGSNNDRTTVLAVVGLATPNAIVPGYNLNDYNLDGVVKYNGSANDRNVLLGNVGIATPSAVVHDQVAR